MFEKERHAETGIGNMLGNGITFTPRSQLSRIIDFLLGLGERGVRDHPESLSRLSCYLGAGRRMGRRVKEKSQ